MTKQQQKQETIKLHKDATDGFVEVIANDCENTVLPQRAASLALESFAKGGAIYEFYMGQIELLIHWALSNESIGNLYFKKAPLEIKFIVVPATGQYDEDLCNEAYDVEVDIYRKFKEEAVPAKVSVRIGSETEARISGYHSLPELAEGKMHETVGQG